MRNYGFWIAFGAVSVGAPALWMWGFTVDDALISIRYAQHLSAGLGWRFSAHGPSSDGVTPLPWPLLLCLFARGDALSVLLRAKVLGFMACLVEGALLGRAAAELEDVGVWARTAVFAVMALCVPLAAHAVSGMETSLATLLATGAALAIRRPNRSAVLAGLASSLRPEMALWACVMAAGASFVERRSPSRVAGAMALSLGPFVVAALARLLAWGRPAPLALLAKPSDLTHGAAYLGAAVFVSLVPLLVLAPLALWRTPRACVIALAAIAHGAAIIAVGGDWMPYARLLVPIIPSLAYSALLVLRPAHSVGATARAAVALALGVVLVIGGATSGRTVGADREALVRIARPRLGQERRVAALDVGWLGAATEADIVDLGGVTDLAIAVLPGGHTSKRVSAMFLLERDANALLLYAPTGLPGGVLQEWRQASYARIVEARLADDDVIARHFAPVSFLPLGTKGAGYVLLERRDVLE